MFRDRLKELREKAGLTQKELGEKIFVSRSAICKWEMGNGIPSETNLLALCEFFNVDEDWLLDRNDLKATVKMYKLQMKNLVMSVLSIIIPIFLFVFSILPLFEFRRHGLYPEILINFSNKFIFYFLNWWSIIPVIIWVSNFIFFNINIKTKLLKSQSKPNF